MGMLQNIIKRFPIPVRAEKAMQTISMGWDSWWRTILEANSGDWQKNIEWSVRSVLSYPTVFACISLIADDIGKLPPGVVRESSDGIWVKTKNARIDALLRRPNRYQNHIQFKQWWITSKLIRGNTYALKERDNAGNVVALYILNPEFVQILVTDTGDVYYQIGNDNLTGVPEVQITVPASEVIHDRMNCLFHPLIGISPLFASGLAAAAGLNLQNDAYLFFANGARPSGILTAPGEISQETAARLKALWEANYTGKNAGKIAVLGDALKFEAMRMTSVDAQLIDQLKWTDQAICSTFKVPAYKVGVGPIPSTTNVEALTQEYYTQCLQIHIESMELCLDIGLDLREGMEIRLDLDVLFRMDQKTLYEVLEIGARAGLHKPNEGRKRINLPPVIGGNSPMMQQQNYSLEALDKRDSKPDPFATGGTPAPQAPPAPSPEATDDAEEQRAMQADMIKGIIAAAFKEHMAEKAPEPAKPEPIDTVSLTKLLPMFLREELRCDN